MQPTLELITPAIASRWLGCNVDNRKLPVGNMKFIAREMEAGEFKTTHQAIAFTGTRQSPGRLLDGQTRLTAIEQSGVSVKMWVFWGCSEDSFDVIDSGKVRSFADRHRWSKERVAFMNILYWTASGYLKPLISDAEAIMDKFGWCFELLISASATTKKGLSCAAVRSGCAIAMHQNPDKAEIIASYYASLVTYIPGNRMEVPTSVRKLYQRLIEVVGAGRDAIMLQLPLTHKAMTPDTWKSEHRLVLGDSAEYIQKLREYIQTTIK